MSIRPHRLKGLVTLWAFYVLTGFGYLAYSSELWAFLCLASR
jgi:hypothetical protein